MSQIAALFLMFMDEEVSSKFYKQFFKNFLMCKCKQIKIGVPEGGVLALFLNIYTFNLSFPLIDVQITLHADDILTPKL